MKTFEKLKIYFEVLPDSGVIPWSDFRQTAPLARCHRTNKHKKQTKEKQERKEIHDYSLAFFPCGFAVDSMSNIVYIECH